VGFPLIAAITAAVLYFAPLYLDGIAEHWEIALFVVGLVLIGIELFVIPGFGIVGISGIIFAVLGLTLAMVNNFEFNPRSPGLVSKISLIVVVGFRFNYLLLCRFYLA
jgi:membrane-bound serine protease (ClpP class)